MRRGFEVRVVPSSVLALAGERVTVVATTLDGRAATVHWLSAEPEIAQMDTTVGAGVPVVLQALRVGSTILQVTVTRDQDVVRIAVPVSVGIALRSTPP